MFIEDDKVIRYVSVQFWFRDKFTNFKIYSIFFIIESTKLTKT